MTAIAFYFNVPSKLEYACRLLRKAYRQGAMVGVVAEPAQLVELDRTLWTFDPVDFIPHARLSESTPPGGALGTHTRVWLAPRVADLPHRAVLVNLGPQVPPGFEAFERVIELVTEDEADRQQARQRWMQYRSAHHAIEAHEVGRTR
jgi:DNA polymerase-3 subunit chi